MLTAQFVYTPWVVLTIHAHTPLKDDCHTLPEKTPLLYYRNLKQQQEEIQTAQVPLRVFLLFCFVFIAPILYVKVTEFSMLKQSYLNY